MAFSDAMKAYLKKQGKTDAEIAALEAAADTSGADTASDTPIKPKVDSTKYPSTGVISLWLFVEWVMVCFKNGNNAKNSLEGIFRKKIYRKHFE
jgi:hypothetical protein